MTGGTRVAARSRAAGRRRAAPVQCDRTFIYIGTWKVQVKLIECMDSVL